MGLHEEGGRAALGVIDALKSTPMILAILIFNVLFMGITAWNTHSARTAFIMMMQETLRNCLPQRSAAPMPPRAEQAPSVSPLLLELGASGEQNRKPREPDAPPNGGG